MNSDSEPSPDNPYVSPTEPAASAPTRDSSGHDLYWTKSLKIVASILFVWAFISLGCGILFRDLLDSLGQVGGAPLGFWMAQQGSIIGFLVLLFVYMILMNRLDRSFGFGEGDKE